jgi:alanine dehydrogenase
MKIGVPKEIKAAEFRVALTPAGARTLTEQGNKVIVQSSAGAASGFTDDQYRQAGALIAGSAGDVWEVADLVLKVKEPLRPEFEYLKGRGSSLILFTYLHLAGVAGLAEELCSAGTTAVAYETVELDDGTFPLLAPMSHIAGRLAVHAGARYLSRPFGTRGLLLDGGPGIPPARVCVIGAGVVGQSAARLAMSIGADVTLLNRSTARLLSFLSHGYPGSLRTLVASPESIAASTKSSDLVIGAVYVSGAKAAQVVTREMVSEMEPGSVIVDVSIDQGGCVVTARPTTYEDPVFEVDGVIHYCVANMPGAVPRTSTIALTNETLRYAAAIAGKGIEAAASDDPALARGVNIYRGTLANSSVGDAVGLPATRLRALLQ